MPAVASTARPVVAVAGLGWAVDGVPVLQGLTFDIRPGLTLVRGGDGRGKTTLLQLLAGRLAPSAGRIHRDAASIHFENAADATLDAVPARAWLGGLAARHPGWQPDLAEALVDAFGLAPHAGKPLHMLSTGSRRKVGLVAAAASGADLTLLDTPFAALDMASCRLLAELLREAADDGRRAWVVADHAPHPALAGVPLAATVDLGD